jgi:Cu(I)/Ag(I) efflux system protein CusF
MKHSIALSLVLTLSVAIPSVGHAQPGGMKDMDMKGMKGMEMKGMEMQGMDMKGMDSGKKDQRLTHKGIGVVKKVDPAKSTVTLDHESIKSMNWSAMTMTFAVKDKKLLDKLQTGKKVEFEFVQQGKDYVITSLK